MPRKVLSLPRRMDIHQTSMESIQGNLSSFTKMVAQISINVGKHPALLAQASTLPPATSSAATPPPYHPNLSPIPKVSTPLNLTGSSTRPVHFGNTSPHQALVFESSAPTQFPTNARNPPKSQPFSMPMPSAPIPCSSRLFDMALIYRFYWPHSFFRRY